MTHELIIKETSLETEASRMFKVCNACRYCEGFCAVFPAMTQRRDFSRSDLSFLSNLCHNCNACYHGCQYSPPHEFAINIPKTLADLRVQTYQEFAWPNKLSNLFHHSGLSTTLLITLSLCVIFGLLLALKTPALLFQSSTGPGAFYKVISHQLMAISASSTFGFSMIAIWVGLRRFWQHCELGEVRPRHLLSAIKDAAVLRYLGDNEMEGCNDLDESFSNHRKYYHQSVMWGFLMCFASTCVATFYDYALNLEAPYGYFSAPVLLGTVGGIGLVIGCLGLFFIKWRSDPNPLSSIQVGLDYSFIVMLFMSGASGLLLLGLRETSWMQVILAIHLSIVLSLFVLLPYSKFVHAGYRFIALIKFAKELDNG